MHNAADKPKGRWFQFRLRSLLLLVALAALGLFVGRMYGEPYRRQRETMALIERLGGTHQTEAAEKWLRRVYGTDLLNITAIDLADAETPEAYIESVADLPRLATLQVGGERFSDEHVRRLRGLKTLRGLVLDSTDVSEREIAALQCELPHLIVHKSQRALAATRKAGIPLETRQQALPPTRAFVGQRHAEQAYSLGWYDGPVHPLFECDTMLRHVKPLETLRYAYLQKLSIGDAGVSHFERISDLTLLRLDETSIGDPGLGHLAKLRNLQTLVLSHTRVTDGGLEHLSQLGNLRTLFLDGNAITDAGLAHLASLRQITQLSIAHTRTSDAGCAHLKKLPRLERLDITGTRITQYGVEELRAVLPSCVTQRLRP